MSFWTLDRVAEALGSGPSGGAELRGVSTDTRTIEPGSLFVALRGERFDAHAFLADAVQAGAVALVVAADHDGMLPDVPTWRVPDTLVALADLARFRRRAWTGRLVAVAGSNGKTTTKELIRAALATCHRVHATAGNLNNRIGVPLTLLALEDDAAVAVIEAGTNEPGEVAILRDICEPDVSVVTSIGEEHLEGLGDLEGVLREEIEIARGVRVLIAPFAHPEVAAAGAALAGRVVVAGLDGGDLRAERWSIAPDGMGLIVVDGVEVRPPIRGEHNLRNCMLALAVAREFGVSMADAALGIAGMPLPGMRTSWERIGGLTLINDAYNANPPSVRAALALLRNADGGRQRVAVLGSMLELGEASARLHEEMAALALSSGFDVVAGVGLFAEPLRSAAAGGAETDVGPEGPLVLVADDVESLWPRLRGSLAGDAVLLLKGSRGVRLERLVPHLISWATH